MPLKQSWHRAGAVVPLWKLRASPNDVLTSMDINIPERFRRHFKLRDVQSRSTLSADEILVESIGPRSHSSTCKSRQMSNASFLSVQTQ